MLKVGGGGRGSTSFGVVLTQELEVLAILKRLGVQRITTVKRFTLS